MKCPDCKGKGRILLFVTVEDPCRTCEGTGEVPDEIPDEEVDRINALAEARQNTCDESYGDLLDTGWTPWPYSLD